MKLISLFIFAILLCQLNIYSVLSKDLDELVGAVGSLNVNTGLKESVSLSLQEWPSTQCVRNAMIFGDNGEIIESKLSDVSEEMFVKLIILFMQIKVLSRVLRLKELFLSNFWLETNGILTEKTLIYDIFSYLKSESTDGLKDPRAICFFDNFTSFFNSCFPDFKNVGRDTSLQMKAIIRYKDKIICEDPGKSLVIFLLIFDENGRKTLQFLLLFLFICTFREFSGLSFSEGLEKVLRNENNSGRKLIGISGDSLKNPISLLLKHNPNYSFDREASNIDVAHIQYPLNLSTINVRVFGVKLCFALLELIFVPISKYIHEFLFILLASRFNTPEEIMLAFELITFLLRSATSFEEASALLLYDDELLRSYSVKVLRSHNIDISTLKELFSTCLEAKSRHSRFSEVILQTDYQIASMKKKGRRRGKIKLSRK
ncbi:putative Secreted Protein [Cryptosporidium tyzzeri]|nr:putative Secreted Protein [Cryptosporidium tyzzeri]